MEEKKLYPVNGTVTISTEEYRDLIESSIKSEHSLDKMRSDWCSEYGRANRLQKELEESQEHRAKLEAFVNSKKDLQLAFKLFRAGIGEEDDA